jgi:hypothetical protein
VVLDLGIQVLTGRFPKDLKENLVSGPLRLVRCLGPCGLVQLAETYDLDEMYGEEYGYRSGLNASMVRHLGEKVKGLISKRPLAPGDLVLDIGSNDGTTLGFYPSEVERLGIDPTTDKFRRFHPSGIRAEAAFFDARTFDRLSGGKKAKIITSISMFYDLPAPLEFVKDVAACLADDGIWHLEQSYLPLMLEMNSYDTACHEHLEYYSLTQLNWMFERAGLRIIDVSENNVNGGSFAVTVSKGSGQSSLVEEILAKERFLSEPKTWNDFAARVARHKIELPDKLSQLKKAGQRVFGLGASTKGNVVLQYCGIGPELLEAIAEVNSDKFGSFTPGTLIPIRAEAEIFATNPDVLMVLPWHFRETFLTRQHTYLERGGTLLFPLPTIEACGAEARIAK